MTCSFIEYIYLSASSSFDGNIISFLKLLNKYSRFCFASSPTISPLSLSILNTDSKYSIVRSFLNNKGVYRSKLFGPCKNCLLAFSDDFSPNSSYGVKPGALGSYVSVSCTLRLYATRGNIGICKTNMGQLDVSSDSIME